MTILFIESAAIIHKNNIFFFSLKVIYVQCMDNELPLYMEKGIPPTLTIGVMCTSIV